MNYALSVKILATFILHMSVIPALRRIHLWLHGKLKTILDMRKWDLVWKKKSSYVFSGFIFLITSTSSWFLEFPFFFLSHLFLCVVLPFSLELLVYEELLFEVPNWQSHQWCHTSGKSETHLVQVLSLHSASSAFSCVLGCFCCCWMSRILSWV